MLAMSTSSPVLGPIPFQMNSFKEHNLEELEAAKLLLSVSPTCRPVNRPRSLSLDALCDVALGDPAALPVGPNDYSSTKFSMSPASVSFSSSSSLSSSYMSSVGKTIFSTLKRTAPPSHLSFQQNLVNDFSNKRSKRSSSREVVVRKVGAYTLEERKERVARFVQKRNNRIWTKKVRYSCRKNLAQCRTRVKGRFVSSKNQPNNNNNEDDFEEEDSFE